MVMIACTETATDGGHLSKTTVEIFLLFHISLFTKRGNVLPPFFI